ncbi:MAG: hypothetical protein H8E34_08705 [Bacteroidetes bacterium]|nr:hypothetical protein [Bacteroidota bacterium]MBL6944290.1 hypothetical protein [Bacteroidales bacterium]
MFGKTNLIRYSLFATIFTISVCLTNTIYAQPNVQSDPIIVTHSPKKATYLALVPGLGQIYNKKYWKLPIVYAGFTATTYFAIWNRGEYLKYNEAYVCVLTDPENCDNELALRYDSDQLKTIRDYYRRNMELSFILTGVWYIIQILDASVDAHLYYWEVNDNLSVKVEPVIQQTIMPLPQIVPGNDINHNGLKITFSF